MGRLWRDYIVQHKGRIALAFLFMLINAAATAAIAWLLGFLIETISSIDQNTSASAADNATNFFKIIGPIVMGIAAVSGVSLYLQTIASNSVALRVIADLQKNMFSALHRADFARFQREAVGNLVSRFTNDVNLVAQALLRVMSNLIRDVLKIVFLVALMLYQDWMLTALVLVVYPLAIWPIIAISKRLRGASTEAQGHMGKITSLLNESFGGARMVRTYRLEGYENERSGLAFDERIRLYLKLVTNHARVDPILEVLGGLAIAGVLTFGMWRVSSGASNWGQLGSVLGALMLAAQPVRALGTLNNVVQEGLAALKRIFDVIDEKPGITEAEDAKPLKADKGHVKLDGVTFEYEDGTKALNGVKLEAKPGQMVALVGPSGGGKSTIINIIPRLYDVAGGAVTIDGQDVRHVTLESLRENIALVSQDVTLFEDTIRANIAFGKLDATEAEIEAAAKAAAAHDFILEQPGGYEALVGEGGAKLSGGQRQRIALARAMLRDAPILLLDEATSALDAESEAKVQDALERLQKGRTTFVIAHRLSTVRNADKIYVLKDGEVVESGKHATLVKKDGLYAHLRKLQFED